MNSDDKPMWERLPNETPKAYKAFCVYRSLPITNNANPEEQRSLLNVSRKLGYAHGEGTPASTISNWASKYSWVDRATAYDEHSAIVEVTLAEADIARFQQEVIDRRTTQIAMLNDALDAKLMKVLKASQDTEVEAIELVRITEALKKVDDISRRLAKMPTKYQTDNALDFDDEQVFIIGGKGGETEG